MVVAIRPRIYRLVSRRFVGKRIQPKSGVKVIISKPEFFNFMQRVFPSIFPWATGGHSQSGPIACPK